jgi:hypothetical protein
MGIEYPIILKWVEYDISILYLLQDDKKYDDLVKVSHIYISFGVPQNPLVHQIFPIKTSHLDPFRGINPIYHLA